MIETVNSFLNLAADSRLRGDEVGKERLDLLENLEKFATIF